MQRCNERMSRNIINMFRAGYISGNMGFDNKFTGYEKGNVWQSFMKVNLEDKQNMEIPLCMFGIPSIIDKLCLHDIKELIMPVNYSNSNTTIRTADAIVKHFITYSQSLSSLFHRVFTNRNNIYYGSQGIILNHNKKLLFMVIVDCSIKNHTLNINNYKIYVHPSVFYTEEMIEKCIINKILPYVLSHRITLYIRNDIFYNPGNDFVPEIIVNDITDKYFYNAIIPNDVPSKEKLDQCLLDHINEVDNITWKY